MAGFVTFFRRLLCFFRCHMVKFSPKFWRFSCFCYVVMMLCVKKQYTHNFFTLTPLYIFTSIILLFSLSLHTAAATMPLRPITPALPMPWTFLHQSALWGHKKTKSKTIGLFHAKSKALDTAYFLRYSGLFKWSRCRDLNPGPFGPEWDYGAFHAFCIWLFSPKFRRILAYVLLMLSQVFPLWENQIENQYGASTRRTPGGA